MNTEQERRVVEALQALTGGLTVTEQDILTANNRLRDNLEPPSPRRKLVGAAIVAAAAAVAGLVIFQATNDNEDSAPPPVTTGTDSPADTLRAALEPNGYSTNNEEILAMPAPSVDDLAGLWLLRPYLNRTLPIMVTGNGSYRYGDSGPFAETIALSGHVWERRPPDRSCPLTTQAFTAGMARDGSIRVQVDQRDNICTFTDGLEVWDPVGPGTPVAGYWLAESEDADWAPGQVSKDLTGLYVAPTTGHVLAVAGDGTYRYYESPGADELVPDDRGELFLEPATLAASCEGGTFSGRLETAQLPGVNGLLAGTRALRFHVDNNQCASSDIATNELWVRLIVVS